MNSLTIKDIIAVVNGASDTPSERIKQSPADTAFMEARIDIVAKLLGKSYTELNLKVPEYNIIMLQAAAIANQADISNYHLKWAFDEAVERKKYDDFKTPITANDLEIAIQRASSVSNTYSGKNNKRLPKLTDKELWTEKVCYFALNFEQPEFNRMKQQLGYTSRPTASICQDEAINAVKQIANSFKRI